MEQDYLTEQNNQRVTEDLLEIYELKEKYPNCNSTDLERKGKDEAFQECEDCLCYWYVASRRDYLG